MKLMILGGTRFVGRHIAESALARGHELTLLTRGTTNPDLFADNPAVSMLRGDRTTAEGLAVLADGDRRWDAVLDVNGYFPRDVRASANLLKQRCDRYLFVSSVSVYKDFSSKYMPESGPLQETDNPEDQTEITGDNYGALKVLCEEAVIDSFGPERSLVVRPGLVVGPYDSSDRFTYWPLRVALGGEVLAPGQPGTAVQFIDVRDLAAFTVTLVEQSASGIYNATGPSLQPLVMQDFLEACRATLGGEATFTWVSDWLLEQYAVTPYTELPLWIPATPDVLGIGTINCRRALAAGLTYRPLPQTISDTYRWLQQTDQAYPPGQTLTPEKERRILLGWHRLSHPFRG